MTAEWIKEIPNWEKEYASMEDIEITKRQRELLGGAEIKSHEGMMYGAMYNDWKKRKGYNVKENIKSVNSSDDTSE